jgi:hypothetical protein
MQTITAGTWAELRAAYLAGAGLRSLARRAGIAEGTVLAHAHREGWSASKRQALQKAGILTEGRQSQSTAIADAAADDHAERAQRHVQRMGGLIERLGQHAEKLAVAELWESTPKLDAFDRLARRNYGLDSQAQGQVVNILCGAGMDFTPASLASFEG